MDRYLLSTDVKTKMASSFSDIFFRVLILGYINLAISFGLRITNPPGNNLYTIEGADFSIECERDGLGVLNWYRRGDQLTDPYPEGISVVTSSDGSSEKSVLTKAAAKSADAGLYGCEAEGSTVNVNVKFLDLEVTGGMASKPLASAWLHCADPTVPQGSTSYTVRWVYGADDFEREVLDLDNEEKYVHHPDNGSLEILKVDYASDLGNYSCEILDPSGKLVGSKPLSLTAVPFVHKFDERSKNLNKGSDLTLTCKVDGFPEPKLSWLKDEEPVDDSDDRVAVSEDGSELTIRDLRHGDRGMYYCLADSGEGRVSNSSIMVRVKDPLAPLWPFIGIVIEVAILVVIIILHERARSKRKAQELQEENASLTGNNDVATSGDGAAGSRSTEDIELRKRKS